MEGDEQVGTLVVGAGQAGLATSHHLARHGRDHVVLDAHDRVGDAWRCRWDSLRLFTPRWMNALPGQALPGPRTTPPSKDEMADHLERYADDFDLPVRTGVRVHRVTPHRDGFEVSTSDGRVVARDVVLATGGSHRPRIPAFATELDDEVVQLHARAYRRPDQLRDGGVLVVGAGNSGAEIALDVADRHDTRVSGRDPGNEPTRPGTLPDRLVTPLMWFVAHHVLRVTNPLGRAVRDRFMDPPRGVPRGRVRARDLASAGVVRLPRTVGVRDGRPVTADGRAHDVANVVWCTGFVPDFAWVDAPILDDRGWPIHERGVVSAVPGLYVVGLPFQYALTSALVAGVGRDAGHVVDQLLARHTSARTPVTPGRR